MVAAQDADRAAEPVGRPGSARPAASASHRGVELGPGQRAALVDQRGAARAAYGRRDRCRVIGVVPCRRTTQAIRRYLSGRIGAIIPARTRVRTTPDEAAHGGDGAVTGRPHPRTGKRRLARELVEGVSCMRPRTSRSTSSTSGSSPNSSRTWIGSSTCVTILRGQRQVRRDAEGEAEGEAEGQRRVARAQQLSRSRSSSGEPLAAAEEEVGLLAADADHRDDRDVGLERGADVALAAVEVDAVGLRWSAGRRRSRRRGRRSSRRRTGSTASAFSRVAGRKPARGKMSLPWPMKSMSWARM